MRDLQDRIDSRSAGNDALKFDAGDFLTRICKLPPPLGHRNTRNAEVSFNGIERQILHPALVNVIQH